MENYFDNKTINRFNYQFILVRLVKILWQGQRDGDIQPHQSKLCISVSEL
jgi:hypothetical protein